MKTTVNFDVRNVKLTDFMKAIGYEHPVATDGNLRIYNAPYDDKHEPTMVVNTETNLWRDTKSGAYGSIYDLAYELTGSCNMSELNYYIAGEMGAFDKPQQNTELKQTTEQKQESEKPPQPKRRMRL